MPTIEEIESDIRIIIKSLLSDISAINDAVNTVGPLGILDFTDVKQFEKGINKQILKLENLRTKVRKLKKLRSKK